MPIGTQKAQAVKEVWKSLTPKQKKVIQKEYPIKGDRNELLRSLFARKVTNSVLAELSGMGLSQVKRVTGPRRKKNKTSADDLRKALKPYEKAITALYEFMKAGQ